MAFLAVFILRRREPDLPRPYKVPLYPVIPLIALVAGVFVLINTLFTQPILVLVGVVITLLGIPIYLVKMKRVNH